MGYPSEDRMYEDRDYAAEKAAVADRRGNQLPVTSQREDISDLHDVLEQLTQQLESVLRPEPTEADSSKMAEDRKIQSPLAEALDNNNRSIRRATQKIRALIDRLEC